MDINKVVVIGAGTMGSGIAYVSATSGYQVTIIDQNEEFLKSGMKKIRQKLKEGIERGKMSPAEAEKISKALSTSTEISSAVGDAQLVIEAIFENMEVKKQVFSALSEHTPESTILASNTSTLSLSEIASTVKNPSRVIGLHFFNPAEAMKLLEIVIADQTSEETKTVARKFGERIGKTMVEAKDSPGFIVNRLSVPMLNEAVKLLDAGIASKEDIDKAMVLGMNHPVGPFTLADMVGLDVALAALKTLEDAFGEQYAPSPSLKRLVEEGKFGMKTGEGFYKY